MIKQKTFQCTLKYLTVKYVIGIELIDTCWDVNQERHLRYQVLKHELIDTCWDVNAVSSNIIQMTEAELIDTCWDVNLFAVKAVVGFSWN